MKTVRLICGLCLLLVGLLAIGLPGMALAQEEEEVPAITEMIVLRPTFPTVEGIAGADFQYEVECLYFGEASSRTFDLSVTAPQGWEVYMTPQYEKDKKISSINLQPAYSTGVKIIVYATAPFWPLPEPGEYKITLEAVSDTVQTSVELTAKITAKYILQTAPANDLYNTKAKAGEENIYSIVVTSLSTDVIDNIQFSSEKPDGWEVSFRPEKIEVLEAFSKQTVDVVIKPAPKAVAGDYMLSLQASGKQATATEMSVRVTVETPTVWGWVGVAIILIVVIGLIVIFMRFSRR
jgi:uncharacterized membrane protein